MRLQLEKLGRIVHIDDDKGYVVAILIALIIVSSVVAGYYLVLRPQPEAYNTLYLLDSQKKAIDYPETLIANQNSTFSVYVDVVNHLGDTANYQVQVKVTNNLPGTLPVDTQPTQVYDINKLPVGRTSENKATVTLNDVGSYWVVFELWQDNGGTLQFTGNNCCVLPIQVTN
jgi:uncharacterized membrane protein